MGEWRRVRLNQDRCTGCYACAVACMDQHYDMDEDSVCLRYVLHMERENQDGIRFASIGCMHCEDTPCVFACPTGAVFRDEETGLVAVEPSKCIGCHSCALACPNGAPRFDKDNRMVKCDGCLDRVKAGLLPVCVTVCPTRALSFTGDEETGGKL